MAYIYQITNDINGKIYIGKTQYSLERRFQEHCRDSRKSTEEHRPLYAAMRKYGIEHFHIELIEETNNPEEREIYWIEQKGSFKNGYNATKGGDGKYYLDYDLIVATYKELQNINKVCNKLNIDKLSVRTALKSKNITPLSSQEVAKREQSNIINQYDLENNYIQSFPSAKEAARMINKPKGVSHITDVCKGRRKTAYGYIWKWG